jgi:hypothetical protein
MFKNPDFTNEKRELKIAVSNLQLNRTVSFDKNRNECTQKENITSTEPTYHKY